MLITERPVSFSSIVATTDHHKLKQTTVTLMTAMVLTTAVATASKANAKAVKHPVATKAIVKHHHKKRHHKKVANSAQVNQAPTSAANQTTYTVKSGDTLSQIAVNTGVTLANLEQFNQLSDPNTIQVGQVIQLTNAQVANQTTPTTAPAQPQAPSQTSQVGQTPGQSTDQTSQSAPTTQPAQTTQTTTATPQTTSTTATTDSGDNSDAKAWIAQHESGGSYSAQNGQYIGKYQLSADKLHGDYSPANQEQAADQYVASRYGSWENAKSFWEQHGWY